MRKEVSHKGKLITFQLVYPYVTQSRRFFWKVLYIESKRPYGSVCDHVISAFKLLYLRDCPFNYELQARALPNLDRGNVRGEAHDDDRPYHRLDPAPRVVLRILVIQNRSSAGRHKKNKGFVRFL